MTQITQQKTAQDIFNDATRIVIKVGSNLVIDPNTMKPRTNWLESLAYDVKKLQSDGKEVLCVISGAVASGKERAGLLEKSDLTPREKRLASTMGLRRHANTLTGAFSVADVDSDYMVVTLDDLKTPHPSKKFSTTVLDVMNLGVLPIINENDTVADEELKGGNNDILAATVSNVMKADLFVILSDVDGLYTGNPKSNVNAQHIPFVSVINDNIRSMATSETNGNSTGGMITKIDAAELAQGFTLVAKGLNIQNPISRLRNGQEKATLFVKEHVA